MYIYTFSKNTGKISKFNVDAQICAKCLFLHAVKCFDNNNLTNNNIRSFVENNREEIISHVVSSKSLVFKTTQNHLVMLSNIKPLSEVEITFLKLKIKNALNINANIQNTQKVVADFHNHKETDVISLQLDNSTAIFGINN